MRRNRRVFRQPDALALATSVGLPSFNFVERKAPKPPKRPIQSSNNEQSLPSLRGAQTPTTREAAASPLSPRTSIDYEEILYRTIEDWASTMGGASLTTESKMTRIWQSMLRHSDAGRCDASQVRPNGICTALCLEITRQIFEACGLSSLLCNVLMGGLANSIYVSYDPTQPFRSHQQYADIAHFASDDSRMGPTTSFLKSLDAAGRSSAITEFCFPFLNDELLTVLWNATATAKARQTVQADPLTAQGSEKTASTLAGLVLHERVRLVLTLWQTLSREEQKLVYNAMGSGATDRQLGSLTLNTIMRSLEEAYKAEQSSSQPHMSSTDKSASERMTGGRRSTTIRPFGTSGSTASLRSESVVVGSNNIPLPDVLFGALASATRDSDPSSGTSQSAFDLEQLMANQEEILRTCEGIFDLLCEDTSELSSDRPRTAASSDDEVTREHALAAKRSLCDLLCVYVEPESTIRDKFERSEEIRLLRLQAKTDQSDNQALVQLIIRRQREDPSLLANAINRSPETLLSAITQNLGILRFAITKFTGPVKQFLKLDARSCDHLDSLAQRNKGMQLLWGMDVPGSDFATAAALGGPPERERLKSIYPTAAVPAAPALSTSGESYMQDWVTDNSTELITLFLNKPEILKQLFTDMHQRADLTSFYKLMLELQTTKGVQNFLRRAAVATLERLAQEDPRAIVKVLQEIFHSDENNGATKELLHQLQSSPYLVTCLSQFHPSALQDVVSTDIDMWKHFIADTVSTHDGILKEGLLLRTENIQGGEALMTLFNAFIEGTTATLNLQSLDSVAKETPRVDALDQSTRRRKQQCLYLRGASTVFQAFISPLLTACEYSPHRSIEPEPVGTIPWASVVLATVEKRTESTMSSKSASRSRAKKAASNLTLSASPKKKNAPNKGESSAKADASDTVSPADSCRLRLQGDVMSDKPRQLSQSWQSVELPAIWQSFLQIQSRVPSGPPTEKLTKTHLKSLILDIWIEFLKIDHLQLESASLWTVTPFVCDYFLTRYEALSVAGNRMLSFVDALVSYQNDPRVAFFSSTCGLRTPTTATYGYDILLYYLHTLAHLLLGQMKVFKLENRLEESPDGSCLIAKEHVVMTANLLFEDMLTGGDIKDMVRELEFRPPLGAETGTNSSEKVPKFADLDDILSVFLKRWLAANDRVQEQYAQAFAARDSGSNRIGLQQFTEIVSKVMHHNVSARECRMVFSNVGLEELDLQTFLRITKAYQLRCFNNRLPDVRLQEEEWQEMRLSVGQTNISSTEREMDDLIHYWQSVRMELMMQLDAMHQNKATKAQLRRQNVVIEKALIDLKQHQMPAATHEQKRAHHGLFTKAWQEIRTCVQMLHSATRTQQYLSLLVIRATLVKYVRHARERMQRVKLNNM